MRVFLYARVSTAEQAVHGLSIEAQTSALTEWAKENGHTVVGLYIDAGISARKPASKRPELQRLLRDVSFNMGELVAFTKLDRWFRNISEYYKVQEVLEKYHVNWKATQEDYDTTTASGRLKINIMLSVAQDEADRAGERIKFILQDKAQRGEVISGKVPLGYKIENKKMVIDPETAPMAQDIFQQYATIRSINSLRSYVAEKYGHLYAHTGLRMLLSNERYIGRAHGQDDFCPPLIEPEQFALCQQIIKQRGQRNINTSRQIYLFTGLVRCAECGNRLSAHLTAGKYIYYRCTRYEKLHLCSHKKRTNEQKIEKWLLENLVSAYKQHNYKMEQMQKEQQEPVDEKKIKRKMDKLKDLYLSDLIDRDTYESEYVALRDQRRQIAEKRPYVPIDLQYIADLLSLYHTLSRSEQKEFWGRIIGEVTITNDESFFVSPIRHI